MLGRRPVGDIGKTACAPYHERWRRAEGGFLGFATRRRVHDTTPAALAGRAGGSADGARPERFVGGVSRRQSLPISGAWRTRAQRPAESGLEQMRSWKEALRSVLVDMDLTTKHDLTVLDARPSRPAARLLAGEASSPGTILGRAWAT